MVKSSFTTRAAQLLAVLIALAGLGIMSISLSRTLSVGLDRLAASDGGWNAALYECGTPLAFNIFLFLGSFAFAYLVRQRHWAAIPALMVMLVSMAYSTPAQLDAISKSKDLLVSSSNGSQAKYEAALNDLRGIEQWFVTHKVADIAQVKMIIAQDKLHKRYRSSDGCTNATIKPSIKFCRSHAKHLADLELAKTAANKRARQASLEQVIIAGKPARSDGGTAILSTVTGLEVGLLHMLAKLIESFGIDLIGMFAPTLAFAVWPKTILLTATKRADLVNPVTNTDPAQRLYGHLAGNDNQEARKGGLALTGTQKSIEIRYRQISAATGIRMGDIRDLLDQLQNAGLIQIIHRSKGKGTRVKLRQEAGKPAGLTGTKRVA